MPNEQSQFRSQRVLSQTNWFVAIFIISAFLATEAILLHSIFINKEYALFFLLSALTLSLVYFLFHSYLKLIRLNKRIQENLYESYIGAKMLVQKDRELTLSNLGLAQLNKEFDEVAKILVRRDLELTEANVRLQSVDIIKSQFVTVAAHQLRTPLTGIRWSYLAILEEPNHLNLEKKRIAEDGLKATMRAIRLINDLLNVARIEEGGFRFHFSKQPIMPLVKNIIPRFSAIMARKGIEFIVDSPKVDPLPVIIDEERISFALENLLDNAVKYTPPGGKVILKILQEPRQLKFEVRDTGIGIPQNQLDRVFTKFFRADNALSFQTSGTGLGLYMAKNIIEEHGGAISVESIEGKGTTFIFTLPGGKANGELSRRLLSND